MIANYELVRRLHSGEYADIFLCRDGKRECVVKTFRINEPKLRHRAEQKDGNLENNLRLRFETEITILTELKSSNIVEVLDTGKLDDGSSFYVMPFYPKCLRELIFEQTDGLDITAPLPREQPCSIPIDQSISILRQLLTGLSMVHDHGITHRDIKPLNIRFDSENVLKICDFGFIKGPWHGFTPEDGHFGQSPFMSPEQHNNTSTVDVRTDVYSSGMIAYRILTGKFPDDQKTPPQVLNNEIDLKLGEWILECIEDDPALRPENAGIQLERLELALT